MIWNCPVCGKAFDVLWPHQWAYKIGAQFACSWKCIRANEKQSKGVQEMNTKTKIPVEAKKAAIQAALDGKDPYEPLAPYTSNPKSMWTYIKSVVKKKDPDLYARLPDLRDRKKIETPEGTLADAMEGMKDAANEFFGKCEDMGLSLGKDEAPEEQKITKPVVFDNIVTFRVQRFINCIYSIMTSVLKSEKMSAPEQFMRLKETEYKPLTNLKKREKPI